MMKRSTVLLALVAPLCWGTSFTLAKPAVAQFPPLLMMLLVYTSIALAMLLTTPGMPKTPWQKQLMISAFSVTIQGSLLFYAVKYVDATTANLVLQTQVPAAIFLGWLLMGEKLNAAKLAGTVIAMIGVAIVIGLPQQKPPMLPVLVIILAGFVWALGQVLARKWSIDSGLMILKSNALYGVPQLAIASFVFEHGQWNAIATASALQWAYLAFIAVVGFYLAYVAWFTLLKKVQVDEAAPFVLLMTPVGVLTAVFWLGETLETAEVFGGMVLLIGLAIVTGVIRPRKLTAKGM